MPAHAFTNLSAHLNSALNPIFYYIYNHKIRDGYFLVLNIITFRRYFKVETNKKDSHTLNLKTITTAH